MPDRASLFDRMDITKYPVKKLAAIPLIILLISVAVLTCTYMQQPIHPNSPNSPVRLGVDFTGGTIVNIRTSDTTEELRAKFAGYPIVSVRGTGGVDEKSIEFGTMSESQKDELITMLKEAYGLYEMRDISPLFGLELQRQAVHAVIIAFILMAIVVFVAFRTVIPAFYLVLCAFSNIVITLACMNAMRMELSLATVAALLMLIGYSVDSNILLTRNLLHKKGEVADKLRNAMKTGITMTSTSIVAILAMFLVSSALPLVSPHFVRIDVLRDISFVLLVGLTMDLMNTWLLNAGILRWYVERKERKKYGRLSVKRGEGKKKSKSSAI